MRETPADYFRRTGKHMPVTDVSVAGPILGTKPRPPAPDEACPTLYRDVGPQALAAFLRGEATQFEGLGSACGYLRDATLPPYSSCVDQFGALVVLQPLSLGPWMSGQAGIWVSERGRMPATDVFAIVPGGVSIPDVDAQLAAVATRNECREALGGREYDDQLEASSRALDEYLADWRRVEVHRQTIRRRVSSVEGNPGDPSRAILAGLGLHEKDVDAHWYHLSPARRDEVRARLAEAAARIAELAP